MEAITETVFYIVRFISKKKYFMNQKLYYYIEFVWVCVKIIDSLYIDTCTYEKKGEEGSETVRETPPVGRSRGN